MLFSNYILLPLKQLFRIKMAFFFTLIFPVILYLVYGHNDNMLSIISFFNFSIQSAMLQSVGIFISAQRNTSWGNYVSTLPAPFHYPLLGILISMFMIGVCGLSLICGIDFIFYHVLSINQLWLILITAAIGSIPMGAFGYLIGMGFDQSSSRNLLTLLNLIFLFLTFVPPHVQKILAYFSLPNAWLQFSMYLIKDNIFDANTFCVIMFYSLILFIAIKLVNLPKKRYSLV